MSKPTILVVEDEEDLQQLLCFQLIKNGFNAICADTAEQAIKIFHRNHIDLILLDIMLPGMDGLALCKTIRRIDSGTFLPIIILTAKSNEEDIIAGLEAGADDYITKPFSPRVLLARIKAHLRRTKIYKSNAGDDDGILYLDIGLRIDLRSYEASLNGEKLDLTVSEFNILRLLASNPHRVFSRDQIIAEIRGRGYEITSRAIDVQIHGLRKKLGDASRFIQTVRGVGYRFELEP